MKNRISTILAATGAALLFAAGGAMAQTQMAPTPGGGTGNADMDHSRMGGAPAPAPTPADQQRTGTQGPTMNNQGGGTGGANMDHSQMGGASVGSPAGGTITGNSGSGGPEVQHGHAPTPRRAN